MLEGEVNHGFAEMRESGAVREGVDEAFLQMQKQVYAEPAGEDGGGPNVGAILPFLEERIVLRIPSDFSYLDAVLDYFDERLSRLGLIDEDCQTLIALDEAIVNAIKHGNKCDAHKCVQIVAEFSADGVRFTVTDEGPGFCREAVPDPTHPSRLLEPTGRGLLLIRHFMDEVAYNDCGNQIRMFKRRCGEKIEAARRNGHATGKTDK